MNLKKVLFVVVGAMLLLTISYFVIDAGGEKIRHNYTFIGESENWKAVYRMDGEEKFFDRGGKGQYDANSKDDFTLTFKGTDRELAEIKDFYYSFESPRRKRSTSESFEEPLTSKVFKAGGMHDSIVVRGNDVIEVVVEWDGDKEIFEMKIEE
ncbi:hypothetical protein [Oceanobacillus damuensis]|uniref:hypothetical protein n=1 Tax=Oceanobacillus damuensis TaxID=937928 RepID=UPI000834F133|nr:hypothetical protein [Oceanobacillus damuensis]